MVVLYNLAVSLVSSSNSTALLGAEEWGCYGSSLESFLFFSYNLGIPSNPSYTSQTIS